MIFQRPLGAQRIASASVAIRHDDFESFDGTRLYFSTEGEGPTVLWLYGLACSSLHWTYQIDSFSQSYRCLWMDYRGHHHSAMPRELTSITIETLARDAEELLRRETQGPVVVAGHSMGVNVALELARRAPDRVRALMLLHGTVRRPFENLLSTNLFQKGVHAMEWLQERVPPVMSGFWWLQRRNPLLKWMIKTGGFNQKLAHDQDINMYLDLMMRLEPKVFVQMASNYAECDQTAWIHELSVPSLVLSGLQDKVTPPEEQRLLHQLLPGSRLQKIADGSHCSQLDRPHAINGILQSFLNDLAY